MTSTSDACNALVPFGAVVSPNGGGNGGHNLAWYDQNGSFTADMITIVSSDPTTQAYYFSITGTPTTGESPGFNYSGTFNSNPFNINITYIVQVGDTNTSIATGLLNAWAANASVQNIFSGKNFVINALYGNATATEIYIGQYYPVASTVTMTAINSAHTTVTVTLPSNKNNIDVNPYIGLGRNVPGRAALAGDLIAAIFASGQDSTGTAFTTYGNIIHKIVDPTAGATVGQWLITQNEKSGIAVSQGLQILSNTGAYPTGGDVAGAVNAANGLYWNGNPVVYSNISTGDSSISGTMTAAGFTGAGTGLTGTASSLTAGSSLTSATILTGNTAGNQLANAIPQNSTAYFFDILNTANAAYVAVPFPVSGALKNLYITSINAPATGQTFAVTLYVNGTATSVAATITGPSAAAHDTTHTASITAGQTAYFEIVTSATSGNCWLAWSMECVFTV